MVPVTSNARRVLSFQLLLPAGETGLPTDSKAQAEQIRSVSVDRVGPVIGHLNQGLTDQLDEAIRLHLGL